MSLGYWLGSIYCVGWWIFTLVLLLRFRTREQDASPLVRLIAALVCGLMWPAAVLAVIERAGFHLLGLAQRR